MNGGRCRGDGARVRIWFTSDQHFGSADVIQSCRRPFSSVEDQTEQLVSRFNSVVSDGDLVFHLGDFSAGLEEDAVNAVLARLNGRHAFVRGHHDGPWFKSAPEQRELKLDGRPVVLTHKPIPYKDGYAVGTVFLHGHKHGALLKKAWISGYSEFDVSVDSHEKYMPYCWDDIKSQLP